jgi:hypothetical protein
MNFHFENDLSPSDVITGSVRKKSIVVANPSEVRHLLIRICLPRSGHSLRYQLTFIQDTWDNTAVANPAKAHRGTSLVKLLNAQLTIHAISSTSSVR